MRGGGGGGELDRSAFKGPFPRSTTVMKVLAIAAMLDYDLASSLGPSVVSENFVSPNVIRKLLLFSRGL